ncbi:TonB-dependent receptor [Saccharicrinis aurantiacus]|uniref:TonB-dependent receptor n=1 Tax=Saccharicrinis aurantiacus TaxID=1849719 RepID=UPI00248FBEB4|nr:TonB-dependent receptor [Saccharicrinis aurantiacus]
MNSILKLKLLLFISLISCASIAQQVTFSGTIRDANTGEELIGATVFVQETSEGASSNTYGFYSLSVKPGEYTIKADYLGYAAQQIKVSLLKDKLLNIELKPETTSIDEINIVGTKSDRDVSSTDVGMERMQMAEVNKLPVLFGERDVFKSMQLLPGISSAGEGGSGINVRGGATDQNLILLDEAPVYSASHLLGFFSVFNSDALKDMTVYKGGIPAQYGGRASSVFDIQMKNGNTKEIKGSGGIGLISSRLTLEGPIAEDKVSFIVSGRRTYADIFAPLATDAEDTKLYFYDLNAKLRFKFSDKDQLFLSGYFGSDKFGFEDMGMDWGNATGTARWNHIYNPKLFSNTSFIYSNYAYNFKVNSESFNDLRMTSGIVDYNLKQDFTWYPNPNNTLKFGFNAIHHSFAPGELISDGESTNNIKVDSRKGIETGFYISNKQNINARLNASYGLRFSSFSTIGEFTDRDYDDEGNIIDERVYEKGDVASTYWNVEPRLALTYLLTSNTSLKASYNYNTQYMHLLANSTTEQPTDYWVPVTPNVKPLKVHQYSGGLFHNTENGVWEMSTEVYYKSLNDLVDFKNGAEVILNENYEAELVNGKGYSKGIEFLVRKNKGLFTGWFSYTLSQTMNQFDEINNGEWFSARHDKTHDFSIVGAYQLSKRTSLSATFVYNTGIAVTLPYGVYEVDGKVLPLYSDRNGGRMPDYHRMDVSLNVDGKKRKRFQSSWNFSIYNLYGRENAYSISYRESESKPGSLEAVQYALFKFVPSVTYNFTF